MTQPSEPSRLESPDSGDSASAARPDEASWLTWLAWGWAALLLLVVIAELSGWDDLRLALDFERHLR